MANLMDLVRELKSLNARKKAGEALSDTQNSRRKELKKYLKTALANQSGTGAPTSSTGPAVASATGAPVVSGPQSTPQAQRAVTPPAQRAVTPPAQRAVTPPAQRAITPPAPRAAAPSAFAIDASDLLAEAAASSAVAASVPSATPTNSALDEISDVVTIDALAGMNPLDDPQKAKKADLEAMVARASKAAKLNRPPVTTKKASEIEQVWGEVSARNGYTPPEIVLSHEDYFEGYLEEGMTIADAATTKDLAPLDPREKELHRAGLGGDVQTTVPAGLVFLDDFIELYSSGGLSGPADEVEPDIDDPNLLIPGKRKVTIHLLVGGVKRGVVASYARGALGFRLDPSGPGTSVELSIAQIKAMFVHKAKGRTVTSPTGREITVTFKDGKGVKGNSEDYAPSAPVYSLVPPAGRGQFELIVINAAAAAKVS